MIGDDPARERSEERPQRADPGEGDHPGEDRDDDEGGDRLDHERGPPGDRNAPAAPEADVGRAAVADDREDRREDLLPGSEAERPGEEDRDAPLRGIEEPRDERPARADRPERVGAPGPAAPHRPRIPAADEAGDDDPERDPAQEVGEGGDDDCGEGGSGLHGRIIARLPARDAGRSRLLAQAGFDGRLDRGQRLFFLGAVGGDFDHVPLLGLEREDHQA